MSRYGRYNVNPLRLGALLSTAEAQRLMLPVTWPRAGWRLPLALGPSVSNDLLSVRVQAPVTRCALRLLTPVEGPEEATPSIRRRAAQARNFRGSPPPPPQPRCDTAWPTRLPLFEHRPRGQHPSLEETP